MSINGTMAPRKLKIPIRYAGLRGSFVSNGQSSTSSTSRTGRQNRSRPLRKTQYCDSGGRSSMGPRASSRSPVSASAGSGSRWKSSLMPICLPLESCEPQHRAEQVLSCEWLGYVAICALLLAPELVAGGIFRRHHNHGNRIELRIPLQIAAHLKAVSPRHDDVQQNHARPLTGYGFLNALGVMQGDRPITLFFQQTLHQLDLGGRVVNDQDFFVQRVARAPEGAIRHSPERKSARYLRCASSPACSVQAWRGSRSWRRFAPPAARSAEPLPGAKIHRRRAEVFAPNLREAECATVLGISLAIGQTPVNQPEYRESPRSQVRATSIRW